eukprot:158346-Amphidinium_carterae.1
MAPKKAAAAKSSSSATENRQLQKRWYSFKAHWAAQDREGTQKGQQVKHLADHLATLRDPRGRANFLSAFFQDCGAGGDLGGFIQTHVKTRAETSQEELSGLVTPGKVAELNSMRPEYYESKQAFQAA